MRTRPMHRRTILRGMFRGTAIACGLPTLEAMLNTSGTAYAQAGAGGSALPQRLGIFFFGNGVRLKLWNPAATGPGWALSPALEPLAPVKDYLNVVSGMDPKIPASQGHHTGEVGILSGHPLLSQPKGGAAFRSTFTAPSIDQVVAAETGKLTRFKSLELGISRRVNTREGTTLQYISHNGPDSANPPSYDPAMVFDRLFGADFKPPMSTTAMPGATAGGPLEQTARLRRSVLDAVARDIDSLKLRVGAADRRRLDQHFEHVRGIERRLQSDPVMGGGPSAGCAAPARPGAIADTPQGEQLEPVMTAMSDLLALALACDQTRAFSVMFSGSTATTVFWQVGVSRGHHQLSHDEAGDQPQIQATTVFTMKMFGILLARIKATPEGPGNLLDNCAILASSDCAEGKSHSNKDYPILIAGRAGGKLKSPGVHHRAPGENSNQVLLTLLRAVGLQRASFGINNSLTSTGCSAIEA
jgi:Protein of unknown function (DUF1552)